MAVKEKTKRITSIKVTYEDGSSKNFPVKPYEDIKIIRGDVWNERLEDVLLSVTRKIKELSL